jgi:hypothetical protein
LKSGAHLVIGTFGPDKSNFFTTATDFVLSSVPEPSSGLLLTLSFAAVLLRRTRAAQSGRSLTLIS